MKKKTTKKTPAKRVERDYNLESAILTMTDRDGVAHEYPFTGLPYNVMLKLAMIGAGSLLCKTEDPLLLWEKIRQNRFGRKRTYANMPKVVYAYARLCSMSLENAVSEWKKMTKEERDLLKNNIEIKKVLLQMQYEELEQKSK